MDVSRPYAAVTGGGLEGEVLAVLTGTTKPMTGRQIARMVRRGSDRGVRLALNRLAEHGLVDVVAAPPALLYSLNRDHIAAPVAAALAALRQELLDRLRAAVTKWTVQPVHVSLFGSAARADGGTDSDIDLLVVRPAAVEDEDEQWRAQLERLAQDVRRWTGNNLGLSEVGEDDVARLAEERAPALDELARDAVTLAGPPVRRLVAGAEAAR
jgi:predicted nucleotidyltransferase